METSASIRSRRENKQASPSVVFFFFLWKKFRGAPAQFGPHQLPSIHAAGALDSLFVRFMCIQQTLGRKKRGALFLLSECVCVCLNVCLYGIYMCDYHLFTGTSVLACVCGGPTQSVMCASAEHKAVCSKGICPERVNTLPGEPLTHDPAGLSAPLNMTIHPLRGMCVCFFFFLPLFGCSHVRVHGCLSPYVCARLACTFKARSGRAHRQTGPVCRRVSPP